MVRGKKGFTLIELILVIAILGILAISALPQFLNISTQARQASRDGVVGAVRSGIALWRANDAVTNQSAGTYPATLDAQADGVCATCFGTILANPIADANWTKAGLVYSYDDGTNPAVAYTYVPLAGTFQ